MEERFAKKLRRLVDDGDRVFSEIEKAELRGNKERAVSLRKDAKHIDEAIAVVKAEAVATSEIAVLRGRVGDGDLALDAYFAALKKAERWLELSRATESEILRLEAIRKKTPEQRARLRTVVDLHNQAADAISRGPRVPRAPRRGARRPP